MKIEELSISDHLKHLFIDVYKIETVGDLLEYSEETLLKFRGFGERYLRKIRLALKEYGWELKVGDDDNYINYGREA